nr:hypothetical transcript [Hymenolepis microstoma]
MAVMVSLTSSPNMTTMETTRTVIDSASINNLTVNIYPNMDPPHSQTGRQTRHRTVFTPQQRAYLEERFDQNRYISSQEAQEMATLLGLPNQVVKRWFQNRRYRQKRETVQKGHFVP